jgi:hypothetical protein
LAIQAANSNSLSGFVPVAYRVLSSITVFGKIFSKSLSIGD